MPALPSEALEVCPPRTSEVARRQLVLGAVTLGVRPEHVSLAQGGVPLAVELVEPLGSETLVHGRMADGTALLAKLPGAAPVGERVTVALAPDALHLFDAASGKRL